KSSDTPFGIAVEYNADPFALMEVNGLDDVAASNLQIGDSLIIPLEGCALTAADLAITSADDDDAESTEDADATEEADETSTPAATQRPTVTIPPTAENAQVVI